MSTYDLVTRTTEFSIKVRNHLRTYKYNSLLVDDFRQLIRSSGAIGANYIEANLHLGSKDFIMRAKIAKKEARETVYWSTILFATTKVVEFSDLAKEAKELEIIITSILRKIVNK